MRPKLATVLASCITVTAVALLLLRSDGKPAAPAAPAVVVRVVDGDTLNVSIRGVERSVRIIGADTPERGECGHPGAKARLAALAPPGAPLELVYGVDATDRYGRVLATVYAGGADVAEVLLVEGLAVDLAIKPNVDRAERYRGLAEGARSGGVGLWSSCAADLPAGFRRVAG